MSFITLTRAEAPYGEHEDVLVNPAHVAEVRVITYYAMQDRPARALLLLRFPEGNGLSVLALDTNGGPLKQTAAAQLDRSEERREGPDGGGEWQTSGGSK